jgi:DNA-binding response OmpR family regulator
LTGLTGLIGLTDRVRLILQSFILSILSDAVISRTIDTHVAELRRKLEADPAAPRHILTVRKVGYRLKE